MRSRVLLAIAGAVIGWMLGWCLFHAWRSTTPQYEAPLKVTIIDSGGADIEVKSRVSEESVK